MHAVGVRGQGAVQGQGGQGGEDEGQGAAGAGTQQRGGPAVEEHGHDEDGTDDASAYGADGVRCPVRQVAECQVGERAQAYHEAVACEQAERAAGDGADRPAVQGDEEHCLPDSDDDERGREVGRGDRAAGVVQSGGGPL
jgi:hypothetical protein